MDKGKGKEKEVIEGGDEESAGPTVAGTVDDEEEGDRADRPSKPAPCRQSQSHGRSQSRWPRKRVKSSTFVQDDDDHDESIPAPAPRHTPSYDIYNPPNTHQIVDDDTRCAVRSSMCDQGGWSCMLPVQQYQACVLPHHQVVTFKIKVSGTNHSPSFPYPWLFHAANLHESTQVHPQTQNT